MACQLFSLNAARPLGVSSERQPSSSGQATTSCSSVRRKALSSRYSGSTGLHLQSPAALHLMQSGRAVLGRQRAVAASAGWLESVFGGSPGAAALVEPKQQAMQAVNEAELEALIASRGDTPLLVVFTAVWCGPCKMLYKNLERVSAELGSGAARIVSMDVEACPDIASRLKVQKLPTLLFLGPHDGRPAVRMQGPVTDAVLRDVLTNKCQNLGADMQRATLL